MIINSLQSGKASGPYSIPTEILQTIKQNICYPLKEIINMSFATGVYPDKLIGQFPCYLISIRF